MRPKVRSERSERIDWKWDPRTGALFVVGEMEGGCSVAVNDPSGTSLIALRSSNGRADVVLTANRDIAGFSHDELFLATKTGTTTGETGRITVASKFGRSAETGGGMIELFNPIGNRVATVQSGKNNEGLIMIGNADGEPKAVVSVKGAAAVP